MTLFEALKAEFFPGFRVSLKGRAGMLYREGKKRMEIDSEMLFGEHDIVVYTDSIRRWLPPHDGEEITSAERERIRKNVAWALRSLRIEWA
jgi:hypothetical protein